MAPLLGTFCCDFQPTHCPLFPSAWLVCTSFFNVTSGRERAVHAALSRPFPVFPFNFHLPWHALAYLSIVSAAFWYQLYLCCWMQSPGRQTISFVPYQTVSSTCILFASLKVSCVAPFSFCWFSLCRFVFGVYGAVAFIDGLMVIESTHGSSGR